MLCSIHMLGGGKKTKAVYVLTGYSVCDSDECLDAISQDENRTIMNARSIDFNEGDKNR